MRICRLVVVFFLGLALLSCAKGGIFPLYLRYTPAKDLPSLQQKIGKTLALAPFKDHRTDTLFIGVYTPFQGGSSRFKSDPSPLEQAIQEALMGPLSRHNVKAVPIPSWDGSPESLEKIDADSVLMIEIKRFWTEAQADLLKTVAKTSVQLSLHLGVKKEGKVFTRNVEVEKEITDMGLTPEDLEKVINQTLTEIFDSFFANPY